ncbi:ZP domain-containing protein-like [Montipora foliosa]|uniref:ZP domain-containing protein-like n=1 Tax=Montipora foliosa TaxID=591990 RepID=UPI0035F1546E
MAGPKGALFFLLFVVCVAGNEYGVTLTCGDGEMTVSLVKSSYTTLNASRLHLNDASCRATENTSYITFYTSLDGCGTTRSETESWFTFYNQIKGEIGQIGGAVTRDHDFHMHFNCSYQRKEVLSLSFQPKGIVRPPITDGFGNLTFKMDIYKSDSYKEAYVDNEYPLNVALNDYIHLGYSVESSQLLVVMAVNCKATKDKYFGSSLYYELIKDGCSQDTSMENDYDPTQSFQKFKFRAFRFFNDYAAIYLHCELMACYNNTSSSRCSQGCQRSTGSKRRKREVSEESLPTTTKAYKIGRGPIQFFEKKANAKDAGSTGKQAAVIAGATVGGGVGLAFIICAAVLFVKYRIARLLFKNPNKVGNLYTTREECESRQSSYIEEDDHDMIERNEIL